MLSKKFMRSSSFSLLVHALSVSGAQGVEYRVLSVDLSTWPYCQRQGATYVDVQVPVLVQSQLISQLAQVNLIYFNHTLIVNRTKGLPGACELFHQLTHITWCSG